MNDNIKSANIFNRKIIIEIRYEPMPNLIDSRGSLLKKIIEAKLIPKAQWSLGIGEVKISDSADEKESRVVIYADTNRLSIINSRNETNESFYHFAQKTFEIFKSVFSSFQIIRIGCRIQGTYKAKSNDYAQIVNNFKALFPAQLLLEDYTVKDFRFQLVYQNGQYHIGPINKEDSFLKSDFQFEGAVNNVGFAIDTDNYVIRSKEKELIEESMIKDVYMTTLSVEKSLFDKLSVL